MRPVSARASPSYSRPRSMSAPKTPTQAEKATASSDRKAMKDPMKLVATSISTPPKTSEITAFTETAQCRGTLKPRVCAVKPAEYIDIELISSMPIRAISRYGTAIQVGRISPRKETGSAAEARSGVETAMIMPIRTMGRTTMPAPPTVTPTIPFEEAVRGRYRVKSGADGIQLTPPAAIRPTPVIIAATVPAGRSKTADQSVSTTR
ncbi:hypothetical protein STENM223S_06701 [Streptomyces tendae]